MSYFIICIVATGGFTALVTYTDAKNFLKPEGRALLSGAAAALIATAILSFCLGFCEIAGVLS